MKDLVISEAGGGFMGVGPARYLAELEGALFSLGYGRRPLQDRAALLVGTSVGSIDMALLACGYSAAEVLQLHRDHGAAIFGRKLWPYRLAKIGPQYDDGPVLELLKRKLGDRTMSETEVPLYVTTWDARKKDLKVWGPEDKSTPVWYAVRTSMAAPTYFSPVDGRYTDGGMAANDPLLCGLAAGVDAGILDVAGVKLLELVTSGRNAERGALDAGWGILTTLRKVILPALTAGNASDVGYIARAWIQSAKGVPGQLLRVQPLLEDYDLDATEKAQDVENAWAQQWETDRDRALYFVRA